jgi:membrane-bound ClpP family serine protease
MNTISRSITGILAIILGLTLIIIGFFTYVTLIYGIPILIIGIIIFFNKKEDEIEKIKRKKGGKK